MSSTVIQEMFNKGLVTARAATLLESGELQQADDTCYQPFDPAIWNAPGRTLYGNISGVTKVKGLTWLSFDDSATPDVLLVYGGTGLYTSSYTASSGSFTQVLGISALLNSGAETLDGVQYGNKYFLFLSGNRPHRVGYTFYGSTVVTTCTIAGDGISVNTSSLTTTFQGLPVGQPVTGPGIPANTVIAVWTDNAHIVLSQPSTPGSNLTLTFTAIYLFNGRPAYLLPVVSIENPINGVATGTKTWNTTTPDFGTGYYWYFYTEAFCPGTQDDADYVESAYTGKPAWFQITNTSTQSSIITRNTVLANSTSLGSVAPTHWQVYMSTKQVDITTVPALNTFRRQGGLVDINSTTVQLTEAQGVMPASGWYLPTAQTTLDAPTGTTAFTNAANILTLTSGGFATSGGNGGIRLQTFNISDSSPIGATVIGIELEMRARKTPAAHNPLFPSSATITVECRQYSGSNITNTLRKTSPSFSQDFISVRTMGGPTDLWGSSTTITLTQLNTVGNFQIALYNPTNSIDIDYVRVRFYYTGTSLNSNGRLYRTVSYTSNEGATLIVDAALPGATASTGDVFQGSLVTDDAENPSDIIFSLPGYPEYFPKPYRIKFNSTKKDRVRLIRRLGQVLCVGMLTGWKRVNYLPRETNTDLTSSLGEVAEDIADSSGVVGNMAGCLVDLPGVGTVLAYISTKGLHYTDGIKSHFLNIDLDWPNTVDLSNLKTCVLRNYSTKNWLVLYYPPAGTSHGQNTRALIFHYGPDKIKDGGYLPALGPWTVSARCATEAYLDGVSKLLTGHETLGNVYLEDNGLTNPATYTVANSAGTQTSTKIIPKIRSRRIRPTGIAGQGRVERTYLEFSPYGASFGPYSCNMVAGDGVITSAGLFGSVIPGMMATSTNLLPGSIVTAIAGSPFNNVTVSPPPIETLNSIPVTFTDGAISLTMYGQNIGESLTKLETVYNSMTIGDLLVWHANNMRQSLEFSFEKILDPNSTYQQLSKQMRLHKFGLVVSSSGLESNAGTF